MEQDRKKFVESGVNDEIILDNRIIKLIAEILNFIFFQRWYRIWCCDLAKKFIWIMYHVKPAKQKFNFLMKICYVFK